MSDPSEERPAGEPFAWPEDAGLPDFLRATETLIRHFCFKYQVQAADTADIIQVVLMAVEKKRRENAKFAKVKQYKVFVIKSAHGELRNLIKRKNRHPTSELPAEGVAESRSRNETPRSLLDLVPFHVPADQRQNWILDQLKEQDREAFRLWYFEHWKQQAIAPHLRLSITTVSERVQSARKTLRRRFGNAWN